MTKASNPFPRLPSLPPPRPLRSAPIRHFYPSIKRDGKTKKKKTNKWRQGTGRVGESGKKASLFVRFDGINKSRQKAVR